MTLNKLKAIEQQEELTHQQIGPDGIQTGAISDDIICNLNYVPYIHKQEQFVLISYLLAAGCNSKNYMPKYAYQFYTGSGLLYTFDS